MFDALFNRGLVAAGFSIAMVGCAATTTVKDVLANQEAHLSRFELKSLPGDVFAQLPKDKGPAQFNRIEMQVEIAEKHSDEKADRPAIASRSVFINAGEGYVKEYHEVSSNQIPFRTNYKLSYHGVVPVKWQVVFHARPIADLAQEVKSTTKFDVIPADIGTGTTLEYKFTNGPEASGIARDGRNVCLASGTRLASEVNAAFEGNYVELVCENFGINGQRVGKSTYAYLKKYEVAVLRAYVDSGIQNTMTIKTVSIR